MLLDFISLGNDEVLYKSLYKEIKGAVECGVIKKGEKLPSVREAATELQVSRTTVENAYAQLCLVGIAESIPQKGYFITGEIKRNESKKAFSDNVNKEILYDFSSRRIDTKYADTKNWKKTVRRILLNNEELTSYGDSQGEPALRQALAEYSYKARGVIATAENIVIGAGIGPLLNILCGLIERDMLIGFENRGFKTAENIFSDYGMKFLALESDNSGAKLQSIEKENIDVLFLTSSSLSKISITSLGKRRNEYFTWANEKKSRYIIEDDYNGELRYTARSVPAFQSKYPQKTIYIGSFSKLLLPSVRIAYMVLPNSLAEKFALKKSFYNQTCGKIDQLALAEYIKSGNLEKHLRRLRRLYYAKSRILLEQIQKHFPKSNPILYESQLTAELDTLTDADSEEICKLLLENGVLVMPSQKKSVINICFSGIKEEDIPSGIKKIAQLINKSL